MVVTSAHGEQYNVLIWTAPIRNASGEIIQVMEMMTNITQIRQLQDHLTSLGFLISSISHGIKGLLTGLDGGMYLIDKGVEREENDRIKEGRDVVQLMVDRIRRLVHNILFYAKERQIHAERVDVLGFAEDLCLTMEHKTKDHGIEFAKRFAPALGSFEIDANVVRTALINILENALEAVAADTAKDRHRISLDVLRDGTTVVFDIRDNGIGMNQETMDNLFTLFFSTKGHAGTGLGLYLADKIIRQHGGKIEVESSTGEGSRFQVSLPESLPPSIRKALKEVDTETAAG
jgi:signal transduction histidine kinase